jgi:GNAT superfamily N-acetyltransferase
VLADEVDVSVTVLTGDDLRRALDGVARLRLAVFRDWPYLYDGTEAYERWYLERFARAPSAVIVGAFAGGDLVGAATAVPLAAEHEAFVRPFQERGYDVGRIFHLAESVLLPRWRGRGLGHRFFDLRENVGRAGGFERATFCAVVRPDDHPLRPPDYRPLDPFWRRRGYAPVSGMVARFAWRDLGDAAETEKPMQVWLARL